MKEGKLLQLSDSLNETVAKKDIEAIEALIDSMVETSVMKDFRGEIFFNHKTRRFRVVSTTRRTRNFRKTKDAYEYLIN